MLQVSVVTRTEEFAALVDEWNDLTERSSSATVFDTFDWIWTWWDQIGRRTYGNRLYVVLLRNDAGTLCGVAPLYSKQRIILPIRQFVFLGTGVSDYHDVIAATGEEEAVVNAFFEHLLSSDAWKSADLNQLRDGGNLRSFPPKADGLLAFVDLPQEVCPYIALPDAPSAEERWNALLSQYSKKMRSNIKYYSRSLDRVYTVVRQVAESTRDVHDGLEALFYLHQRRWNQRWLPGVFYSRSVRMFHLRAAVSLRKKGHLRLHILKLDSSIEAVLYCFSMNGVTSYYQGGFEPTLAKLSLGSVVTGLAVRGAAEEGSRYFDFLRGDEPYKRRWTQGKFRYNHRWIVAKPEFPLFRQVVWLVRFEQKVEETFKHWMHRERSTGAVPRSDATV